MSNKVFDSIPNQTIGNVGKFVQTLSPASMSMLSDILRLQIWKMKELILVISGTCLSISINQIFNFPGHWVLNSGTTSHVCFSHASFQTLKVVQNAYIMLPNHTKILIHFAGNFKLTLELILEDVLFVNSSSIYYLLVL